MPAILVKKSNILASGLVETGLLSTRETYIFIKMEEAYGFR